MSPPNKTLRDIRYSDAHRVDPQQRPPIPFRPDEDEVYDEDSYNTVKMKVVEGYEERVVLFKGGNGEQHCKFFQQVDGIIDKKELRTESDEHTKKIQEAEELLAHHDSIMPSGEDAKADASDSESEDSDDDEEAEDEEAADGETEDPPSKQKPKKKTKRQKLTKLGKWQQQRVDFVELINASKMVVADNATKAHLLQEGLFDVEQRAVYTKITAEVCHLPYKGKDGEQHAPRGLTWESFRLVRYEFMLTALPKDSAEQQRYYMFYNLRKPWGMKYRTFHSRVLAMNGYLYLLPSLKDGIHATEGTKRLNTPIEDYDLANLCLRAMQPEWAANWALTYGALPVDLQGFVGKMEAIEQVLDNQVQARRSDKKKNKKLKQEGSSKPSASTKGKSKGESSDSSSKQTARSCSRCKEHGGAHTTHNTSDCKKYDKHGNLKSSFGGKKRSAPGKEDKYSKKNFMSLKRDLKKSKKETRKAKKKAKKIRRSKSPYYSSSSSDSESSSENE